MAEAQIVGGSWEDNLRFHGTQPNQNLGLVVAWTGDHNGDGLDEYVAATWFSQSQTGEINVLSPATAQVLYTVTGATAGEGFGASVVGIGDVNGDGLDDIAVGANLASYGPSRPGSVFLLSGADGSILQRFDGHAIDEFFGAAMAAVGDVDNDGITELLVGANGADPGGMSNAGRAYLLSGATGQTLQTFDGAERSDNFGRAVAGAGDVDTDGVPDLLIGAPYADPGGNAAAGSAYLYSGATGTLIRRFDGEAQGDHFGFSLTALDNLDSDGIPDVLIGAPNRQVGVQSFSGSVYGFAGFDGRRLFRVEPPAISGNFGTSVSTAGDMNGDSITDFVVGAPDVSNTAFAFDAGGTYVYSGKTRLRFADFLGPASNYSLGTDVAGGGNADGDLTPEIVSGAPGAWPGGTASAGSVHLFRLDPFLNTSSRELSVANTTSIDFAIDFPGSSRDWGYQLLASQTGTGPSIVNGIFVPLTADSIFQQLLSGWSPPILSGSRGSLDNQGNATATLVNAPALAGYLGATFYVAVVAEPAGGGSTGLSSIARELVITP